MRETEQWRKAEDTAVSDQQLLRKVRNFGFLSLFLFVVISLMPAQQLQLILPATFKFLYMIAATVLQMLIFSIDTLLTFTQLLD